MPCRTLHVPGLFPHVVGKRSHHSPDREGCWLLVRFLGLVWGKQKNDRPVWLAGQ